VGAVHRAPIIISFRKRSLRADASPSAGLGRGDSTLVRIYADRSDQNASDAAPVNEPPITATIRSSSPPTRGEIPSGSFIRPSCTASTSAVSRRPSSEPSVGPAPPGAATAPPRRHVCGLASMARASGRSPSSPQASASGRSSVDLTDTTPLATRRACIPSATLRAAAAVRPCPSDSLKHPGHSPHTAFTETRMSEVKSSLKTV
jgi:hypothetical protein